MDRLRIPLLRDMVVVIQQAEQHECPQTLMITACDRGAADLSS